MTPEQADHLAMHIAKVWPDEHVDPWAAQLLELDHDQAVTTLAECRRLYTGRRLHPVSFRSAYGPTWPTAEPVAAACDRCSSTGVIDVHDGIEEHCDCGHGHRRRTTTARTTDDRRYLTDAERARGLAHVAALRAQLANRSTTP